MAFACVNKNCDQDVLESLTYELQYIRNITGIALIFSRLVLIPRQSLVVFERSRQLEELQLVVQCAV